MMFSKKHYEAIAQRLQGTHPSVVYASDLEVEAQWERDCLVLASLFRQDNPNFDVDRFLQACEPGANVRARKAT